MRDELALAALEAFVEAILEGLLTFFRLIFPGLLGGLDVIDL